MNTTTLHLSKFYQGWDGYQQHLVKALAPLSAEQLNAQIAPNLRSVYTIAAHIIGARARWSSYVLKIGGEEMLSIGTWDRPGSRSGQQPSWYMVWSEPGMYCNRRWHSGHQRIWMRCWRMSMMMVRSKE
ncbi:DinB family protein [Dictyobacter vulcani]|uniref:DinB family protein n=1 Tax=Dictyobacter vulcani TaxID=2607529 RepID=UPI0022B855D2|nr:DinB family protein [Dictyobacter vulcani]